MKQFWLLVLVFVSFNSLSAQEVKGVIDLRQAPTVEQCRADQKLWLSKFKEPEVGLNNVSYKTLSGWQDEMNACATVDQEYECLYRHTTTVTLYTMANRLKSYLDHKQPFLYEKFIAEDAQGKQ